MNKRKLLILLILFVVIVSLAVSSATAATYKKNINFKDRNLEVAKHVGDGDYLSAYYWSKLPKNYGKKMQITIHNKKNIEANSYKITNANVKFYKKVGKKTVYATRNFKADKWGNIMYNPPNGYKPHSATVTYKYMAC